MTVVLNEVAIAAFFEKDPRVVALIEHKAETIVAHAQVQFDEYFHGVLPAKQDIVYRMEGSSAKIGYSTSVGPKAERLAKAEAAGTLTNPPLQQALDATRE